MEDPESALIVISTLINEKIKKIKLEPITHAEKKQKNANTKVKDPKTDDDISLFHLDFTATVALPDGSEELIMIELQKASEPEDIFRFKRYISKNFQNKQEREITDPETQAIKTVNKPIRLIPIFILNFRIENEINDLLIKTSRIKEGIFKCRQLQKHNEFIDNLIYDIWVVQLPNLHKINEEDYRYDEYKEKLFTLLKLFDQKSKVKNNEHRLRLMRKFFPGFLDHVLERLQSADINNANLEEKMFAEDEYLKALIDRDNKISYFMEQLDATKEQLNTTKEQLDIEIELRRKNDKALDEKDKALDEKDKVIVDFAKTLKNSGLSNFEIQQKTGLSIEIIEKL